MTKKDLYIAVVNQDKAKEFVHLDIPQTDLAEVVMGRNAEGHGTPLTAGSLSSMWLTDEEALEIAQDHTNHEHFTCITVAHALGLDAEGAGIDPETSADMAAPYSQMPLYVLTNASGIDGAAAITRPEILKGITDKMGPVYVLPSSIHEVLIIPKSQAPDVESLKAMVREVNETVVRPEEQLSGNVYAVEGSRIMIADNKEETLNQDEKKNEERGLTL